MCATRRRLHYHALLFLFQDTAPTEIYTLSLHDALPILVGQHAQKNMRRDAILTAMPNRPHQQIDPLQTAESPFYFRQALVAAHRLFRRELLDRFARSQHINPIQLLFLLDRFRTTTPGETALADFAREVLAHFVASQHLPHLHANLHGRERLVFAPRHFFADLLQTLLRSLQ